MIRELAEVAVSIVRDEVTKKLEGKAQELSK